MKKNLFFLAILLIASIGDLLVPVIIGFDYPGYSHLRDTISSLGTSGSPVRIHEMITLIIVGILFIIFSFGQAAVFKPMTFQKKMYIAGIVLFGAGTIIAGIFPDDLHGTPETCSGNIHGIASGIGFLFLLLNPLWAVWIRELKPFAAYNIIRFFLALITFILFILSEELSDTGLEYPGLFQRINLIILYFSVIMNYLKSTKIT